MSTLSNELPARAQKLREQREQAQQFPSSRRAPARFLTTPSQLRLTVQPAVPRSGRKAASAAGSAQG